MTDKELQHYFETEYENYSRRLRNTYEKSMQKAEDKAYIHNKFVEKYDFIKNAHQDVLLPGNQDEREVFEVIDHYKKSGKGIAFAVSRVLLYIEKKLSFIPESILKPVAWQGSDPSDYSQRFDFIRGKSPKEIVFWFVKKLVEIKFSTYLNEISSKEFNKKENSLIKTDKRMNYEKFSEAVVDIPDGRLNTISRQILALYYILKAQEISPEREDGSVLAYTRFVFMVLGKDPDKASNSDHYRNLLSDKYPFIKSNQRLKEDLEYILPFFKNINLDEVAEIIQMELNSLFK